jgi:hypothetical protein
MYKYYRNKLTILTHLSKKAYYTKYFEDNLFNTKKTGEGINNLINRKRKNSKHITSLRCPKRNILSSNSSEFPNIFNKHFSSVGHELASKMPNSSTSFHEYLSISTNPFSFAFNYVSPKELELEIMEIPLNKSYGLYSCPARILKCSRYILSNPLSVLINMSVESGIYPDKLKHAKVIPIFKNDDETDPSNYRPISLLSIFNRIFEKVMYERLKIFFEIYNILYKNQYGFREKRSTQHAIIDIVNQIQTNMDKNMYTCGIFIDLQKAFDTVNHSILLQKLQHYGIRGIINDWFSSYLLNRIQTTQIGTVVSDKETMLSGVPQRSVLGPLLFLIYLNDIYNSTDKLNFSLFADDTNLLYADNDLSLVLGNNC